MCVGLSLRARNASLRRYGRRLERRSKGIALYLLLLIQQLDELLQTNKNFQLGVWTRGALNKAAFAVDETHSLEAMQQQFLFAAKNQISLWGPHGEINDYSAREWAGVVGDYYAGRWTLYFEMLFDTLMKNQTLVHEDYHAKAVEYGLQWDAKPDLYEVSHFSPIKTIEKQYRDIFENSMKRFEIEENATIKATAYHLSKSHDPEMLAAICAADLECMAFNTKGELFREISSVIPESGVNVYLRK